jgi:hypothetical protein
MSVYRGMYRLAVLNSYTAVESLANAVFTITKTGFLRANNVPKEVAETLVEEERERHKTEPNFLLHRGVKSACGRSLLDEDKKTYDELVNLQKMRHRVAHTGYKPTQDEARHGHRVCCEAARWLAQVGNMPVKPMVPEPADTYPGLSNEVKDGLARNPSEIELIKFFVNSLNSSSGEHRLAGSLALATSLKTAEAAPDNKDNGV